MTETTTARTTVKVTDPSSPNAPWHFRFASFCHWSVVEFHQFATSKK